MLRKEVRIVSAKVNRAFHQMEVVLRVFLVLQKLCHVDAVDVVFHGQENFGKLFALVQIPADVAKSVRVQ